MKSYQVVVLGASGSGKTVLLASMYKKLGTYASDVGFFIKTPFPHQDSILVNKFQEIADPYKEWPPGTLRSQISEWVFTCSVRKDIKNYEVFEFSYIDYSGEILTEILEGDTEKLDEIVKRAEEADTVLVLLDGEKVLELMEDKEVSYRESLTSDFDSILPIVGRLEMEAVHFVVSKWDLLEDKYDLQDVRARLLAMDGRLADIVEQRRRLQAPIRLIPISAVGMGFAVPQNGQMKKNPNASPEPYFVEMPIALTLVDGFKSQYVKLERRKQNILFKALYVSTLSLKFMRLLGGLSAIAYIPARFHLGGAAVELLINVAVKGVGKGVESLERTRLQAQEGIEDEQSAMFSAVANCTALESKLEEKFPHSNFFKF